MLTGFLLLLLTVIAYSQNVDKSLLSWGVLQPDSSYQKWRRDENPKDKPYYQWFYYWIRDYQTNEHFAFGYSTSYTTEESNPNQGAYAYLATVGVNGQNIARSEKFDINLLKITQNFTLDLTAQGENSPSFMLHPYDDDTIFLYGKMNHYKDTWHTLNCENNTYIE